MLNLFYYDFGVRLIKPDPNIYYRTKIKNHTNGVVLFCYYVGFLVFFAAICLMRILPAMSSTNGMQNRNQL